jgi:hypothetical protein
LETLCILRLIGTGALEALRLSVLRLIGTGALKALRLSVLRSRGTVYRIPIAIVV